MLYTLSKRSKERMKDVDSKLIDIANLAIQLTLVDFGIPADGGKRTSLRQRTLYTSGVSLADGYKKLSKHQSGDALDFFAYVDHKASWDEAHLTSVAVAFLQAASILGYGIKWGGLWKNFRDMPHIQLI